MPLDLKLSVERIQENCEPALCTVLFMGGAGGSLRAGVTDNPVRLTRSVKDALTRVTSGGAPVYVWPGGGITFMVDVTQMPAGAFGYVPTPALVAPIEFTLKLSDYAALGGHMDHVRPLASLSDNTETRPMPLHSRAARMKRLPQIALLPDGKRLHLQDGPIDLVIEAKGSDADVRAAYEAAAHRFTGLLDELCAELAELRQPADPVRCTLKGVVARRMHAAVAPFAADHFITPMAAVAGSVAEEILGAMLGAARLDRAYVNNGGDIALHLADGEQFTVGLMDRPDRHGLLRAMTIDADDPVRGVATSGRHGRSFSLGIADAVTVLARTASQADAAATIIANAVDLPGHPAVIRCPANELQPDSDLGSRLVTRDVGALAEDEIEARAAGRGQPGATIVRGRIDRRRRLASTGRDGCGGNNGNRDARVAGASWKRDTGYDACLIGSEAKSMSAIIRKIVTVVEETHLEMGQKVAPPTRRAAAIAVIENPFAGRYVEDLSPLIAIGEELGELLSKKAVAALGIDGAKAHSYGKAAAVGENGELEHAAAILHPKMGAPVRKVLSKGAALIPSSKKRSGPGHHAGYSARPQGRGVRAQPFRRHGSADQRRAARQRDHGRGGGHRQRPAVAAGRRIDGC